MAGYIPPSTVDAERYTQADEDEAIASVCCEFHEKMLAVTDAQESERGYRYEGFSGFTGWWRFCAQAGRAYADYAREWFIDDWPASVDVYVEVVWLAVESGPAWRSLADETLADCLRLMREKLDVMGVLVEPRRRPAPPPQSE